MVCEDRELIEKLEERLRWYQEEATEEEFDADEVDAVCTILRKQSPVVFTDKKEAYRKLMERIREENGDTGEENENTGNEDGNTRNEDGETGNIGGTIRSEKTEKVTGHKGKVYAFRGEDIGETEEEKLNKEGKLQNGEEKAGKRRGKRYRAAIILGVCILGAGILFMNSASSSRANESLLMMILKKVGVVKIERIGVNQEEDAVEAAKNAKFVYDSWSELDIEVKNQIRVPEYIPEGFSLYSIKYMTQKNKTYVVGRYYDKTGQHLLFRIYLLNGETGVSTAKLKEEDASRLLSEYSDESRFYYAYDDEYVCLFSMDDCVYKISGDIELEEMVKVVEGFGTDAQD